MSLSEEAQPPPKPPKAAAPTTPATDSPNDRRTFWMGVGLLSLIPGVVLLLFFKPMPQENAQVLTTVIGTIVGTGFGSVIGYYFGSSKSSKDKDSAIINLSQPSP